MDKVFKISKTMGTQMPTMKKRKRKKLNEKDSPYSLAQVFKFPARETCFKEHSRIRIATIHIIHTHTHLDLRV
jgi:hypothetical protein